MGKRAVSGQPRWPKLLLGSVLLWRALSAAALAHSGDLIDARYLAEWSSPGLNRSVKLTFESLGAEHGGVDGSSSAIETPSLRR